MYANGEGIPKNIVTAFAWFKLSAQGEPAWRSFAAAERDRLLKIMNSTQVVVAHRTAEKLRKRINGDR